MPQILNEKIVFDDTLQLEEAELKHKGKTFKRMRINREDGSAILVLNTETNMVILTRQFRYAIIKQTDEEILEIPAGKVDKGYSAEETAVKEIKEETGYKIRKEDLVYICACYISAGYTSEKLNLFYVEVNNRQKVTEGGGLASENEDIKVVEMPLDKFMKAVDEKQITDAKTIMAAFWLKNKIRSAVIPSPH